MDLLIDKESTIQINEQIRIQLKYHILNGELECGSKLPSVREMALALNINRHTISRAYKELEEEGLIITKQSLGTFVTEDLAIPSKKNVDEFTDIIKKSMDKTLELGFSIKEFLAMAQTTYLKEKNDKKIKGLFVECNLPAIKQYVKDLSDELDIEVDGCLLTDLEDSGFLSRLKEYDLIMTTAGHYPTLQRSVKSNDNLYVINFGPYLNVLNKLNYLSKDSNIGIVCISETGAVGLKQILVDLGIVQGVILVESTKNLNRVKQMAENVDYLIVSKYALEENKEFFDLLPIKVIEYENRLEKTSVIMLKEVINNIRDNKFNK